MLGEGLTIIGRLLGHRNVETNARYAHPARDSVKEAAERIAFPTRFAHARSDRQKSEL